jgi:hypothetical protein
MQNYSTKELRERKALTDAIVSNLKIINADNNDLEELERMSGAVNANLKESVESIMRIRHGKTDAALREIPISPRVHEILRARWKAAGKPQHGWVWPNAETASGHIEPSTLKKLQTKACKQAKVTPFVFHEARHTSLTRLGCSGCDAWTLARIAGHQKIQMSMTYVHSQYMDGAGWWGQWWEGQKDGRKRPAAGAEIRYTENQSNGGGEKQAANVM